jgi:hypothetical protein
MGSDDEGGRAMVRKTMGVAVLCVLALAFAGAGSAFAAAPSNDDFANATEMLTNRGASATNVEATLEPGEPAHGPKPGGASVWFRWTASITGPSIIFVSPGAGYFLPETPQIVVYTGDSLTELTPVASIEWTRLDFHAVAGTTYDIAIAGTIDPSTGDPVERAFSVDPFQYPSEGAPAPPHLPAKARILGRDIDRVHHRERFELLGEGPGATLECALDKRGFKPCQSTVSYGRLKPGFHVFRVRAIYEGEVEATPLVDRFRIGRGR